MASWRASGNTRGRCTLLGKNHLGKVLKMGLWGRKQEAGQGDRDGSQFTTHSKVLSPGLRMLVIVLAHSYGAG